MKVILVLLALLAGCNFLVKPKSPHESPSPTMQETYTFYVSQELVDDRSCDAGHYYGLAYDVTKDDRYWDTVNGSYVNGKPHRTQFHDCYPDRSGSTASRDTLIGHYYACLTRLVEGKECQFLEEHLAFLTLKYEQEGFPFHFGEGDPTRTYYNGNMAFVLQELLKRAGIPAPSWVKTFGSLHMLHLPLDMLPQSVFDEVTGPGYRQFLYAYNILFFLKAGILNANLAGYAKALTKTPGNEENAFYFFLDGLLNTGDFSKSQELLKKYFVHDYIYADKYTKADFLWHRVSSEYVPDPNSDVINEPLDRAMMYYYLYLYDWSGQGLHPPDL